MGEGERQKAVSQKKAMFYKYTCALEPTSATPNVQKIGYDKPY